MKQFTIAGVGNGFRGEMKDRSKLLIENLVSDPPFFLHEIIHLCLCLFLL